MIWQGTEIALFKLEIGWMSHKTCDSPWQIYRKRDNSKTNTNTKKLNWDYNFFFRFVYHFRVLCRSMSMSMSCDYCMMDLYFVFLLFLNCKCIEQTYMCLSPHHLSGIVLNVALQYVITVDAFTIWVHLLLFCPLYPHTRRPTLTHLHTTRSSNPFSYCTGVCSCVCEIYRILHSECLL